MLVATIAAAVVVMAHVGRASAARIAAVRNPSHNCHRGWFNQLKVTRHVVNHCRARERIGPLQLPTNFHRLNSAERMLVLVNLARVNRGLRPVVGLSRSLDRLAHRGANSENDPSFPSGFYRRGGSLWAYAYDLMGAQDGWMYDDGWGRAVTNTACTGPRAPGCWAHRDIILMRSRRRLVAGGAARRIRQRGMRNAHSYAFEILAGYSRRHLAFTWKHELRYFKHRPRLELLHKHH